MHVMTMGYSKLLYLVILCLILQASRCKGKKHHRLRRQDQDAQIAAAMENVLGGYGPPEPAGGPGCVQDPDKPIIEMVNDCGGNGEQSCVGGITCLENYENTMQRASGDIGLGQLGIDSLSPSQEDFSTYPTIIRFHYGDNDPLGPKNWEEVAAAKDATNDCLVAISPVNFDSTCVGLSDPDMDQDILEEKKPSLLFRVAHDIDSVGWEFGFSPDVFNGIQINTVRIGVFEFMDEYNSHQSELGLGGRMFDFGFAAITFCDYSKVSPTRSSHQIEGVKYPLEIVMVFFWAPPDIGISSNWADDAENGKSNMVGVSVLGQVVEKDNIALQPLFEAAKNFDGPGYEEDWSQIPIKGKFSPIMLLPEDSDYYYYEGSFPVPPCFRLARLYVLAKPLNISQRQLDILTHMKSAREPSGVLTCTMGRLLNFTTTDMNEILYNGYPIRIATIEDKLSDEETEHSSSQRIQHYKLLSIFLSIYALCIYTYIC